MERADVVIAGAGIIGLATALELASHGLRVVVAERGRAMSEASWAAAGMLAASDPENPEELRELSELSLRLYPAFLGRIELLSKSRVPIRTRLAIQGTRPGRRFTKEEASAGRRLDWAELASLVDGIQPNDRDFLALDERSLDPRDLCAALPAAVREAGVQLMEETEVLAIRRQGSSFTVETSRGAVDTRSFVNCCGAWAGRLAAASSEGDRVRKMAGLENLRIEPRKGQIVTVRLRGHEQLNVVLRTPETYLVPRGDGRVVIGATVERAGFDKAVHIDVVQTLVAEAGALWPPIKNAEIVETWAGLRPGSGDGLPALGSCGGPGCWLATGHFRNGILLAPATAVLLSQLIRGEQPQVNLAAFACDRFAAMV